jgi:hypothetical protein
MSDLVERLRNYATCSDSDVDEAADRIERLEAENAALRVPMKHYVQCHEHVGQPFTLAAKFTTPSIRVCPNCELEAALKAVP